eukprot:3947444-Karenia_brevis.AAC.1
MKPHGLHVLEDENFRARMKPNFCELPAQCDMEDATVGTNVWEPNGSDVCDEKSSGYPAKVADECVEAMSSPRDEQRNLPFDGGWDLSVFEGLVTQPGQLSSFGYRLQEVAKMLPGKFGEMIRILSQGGYEKYTSPTGRLTQRDLLPL